MTTRGEDVRGLFAVHLRRLDHIPTSQVPRTPRYTWPLGTRINGLTRDGCPIMLQPANVHSTARYRGKLQRVVEYLGTPYGEMWAWRANDDGEIVFAVEYRLLLNGDVMLAEVFFPTKEA